MNRRGNRLQCRKNLPNCSSWWGTTTSLSLKSQLDCSFELLLSECSACRKSDWEVDQLLLTSKFEAVYWQDIHRALEGRKGKRFRVKFSVLSPYRSTWLAFIDCLVGINWTRTIFGVRSCMCHYWCLQPKYSWKIVLRICNSSIKQGRLDQDSLVQKLHQFSQHDTLLPLERQEVLIHSTF